MNDTLSEEAPDGQRSAFRRSPPRPSITRDHAPSTQLSRRIETRKTHAPAGRNRPPRKLAHHALELGIQNGLPLPASYICPTFRPWRKSPDVLHICDCQRASYRFSGPSRNFLRSLPELSNYTHFFVAVQGSREEFSGFFRLIFFRLTDEFDPVAEPPFRLFDHSIEPSPTANRTPERLPNFGAALRSPEKRTATHCRGFPGIVRPPIRFRIPARRCRGLSSRSSILAENSAFANLEPSGLEPPTSWLQTRRSPS